MEKEVIGYLGELLHLQDASGHIVTGGTEANIMAMAVAKYLFLENHEGTPEILLPRTAHFSFKVFSKRTLHINGSRVSLVRKIYQRKKCHHNICLVRVGDSTRKLRRDTPLDVAGRNNILRLLYVYLQYIVVYLKNVGNAKEILSKFR